MARRAHLPVPPAPPGSAYGAHTPVQSSAARAKVPLSIPEVQQLLRRLRCSNAHGWLLKRPPERSTRTGHVACHCNTCGPATQTASQPTCLHHTTMVCAQLGCAKRGPFTHHCFMQRQPTHKQQSLTAQRLHDLPAFPLRSTAYRL